MSRRRRRLDDGGFQSAGGLPSFSAVVCVAGSLPVRVEVNQRVIMKGK